jgi:hypothetical protein
LKLVGMANRGFLANLFKLRTGLPVAILLLSMTLGMAADFDGDGVADEFTVTHEAEKVAKEAGVKSANPWQERHKSSKKPPKGVGLVIRLSRPAQKFLVHDPEFFASPMWAEKELAIRMITKRNPLYKIWKKSVPAMRGEAIQLSTEAGIDILLYWDGRWRLFWPDEEP